ncbi:MAG: Gfo/Idh/MocA family protein [Pirellulaceae bacterium]
MSTLYGAMIGAGYFAQFHAEAWQRWNLAPRHPALMTAVVDAVPGRARELTGRYDLPRAYESLEAMFDAERPQFVDIVTRPESHLELVRIAAQRGAHVICQKPMAPTWDDCLAMCEACERAGVRLLIHENWRWQAWYRAIRRLLDEDRCGRVVQATFFWRTGDGRGSEPYAAQPYFRTMPRLLVYETLVHLLDTFRFLFGEIQTVSCRNQRVNEAIAGEDQSHIVVSFANGSCGVVDANRLTGPHPSAAAMGELWIEGDRATLRMTADGQLLLREPGGPETRLPFEPPTTGYKGDSVYATQAHCIECLVTGQPCESEGRDYLRTVRLVDACYESHAAGHVIRVG